MGESLNANSTSFSPSNYDDSFNTTTTTDTNIIVDGFISQEFDRMNSTTTASTSSNDSLFVTDMDDDDAHHNHLYQKFFEKHYSTTNNNSITDGSGNDTEYLSSFDPHKLLCLLSDDSLSENNPSTSHFNLTSANELVANGSRSILNDNENERRFCPRDWDGLLCWPPTPEGSSATLFCFEEFRGIYYDTSRTVSRNCEAGGTWQNITNYATSCVPLRSTTTVADDENVVGITLKVYFSGYCLSLTALTLAIIIFLAFNCHKSWHTPQTSGGQVFLEKPSNLIQSKKSLPMLRSIKTNSIVPVVY